MAETCPVLKDFLNGEKCLENIGGTSSVVYFFIKSELKAPMKRTGNSYATPQFQATKGLYRLDLKDETQQVKGESQGQNKGFNLTWAGVIDVVSKKASELSRALNNLDLGIIIPDGEEAQILYDPNKRVQFQSGGISSDTGAASGDDRQTSLEAHLNGVLYDNLYVEVPGEGWDSMLASAGGAKA